MLQEKRINCNSGFLILFFFFGLWILTLVSLISRASPPMLVVLCILSVIAFFCVSGFFVVNPNQARVMTLFGNYTGTVTAQGFFFINPFTVKNAISLKVVNIHTEKTKVNDAKGNPIEIAAVIVWRVSEPYKALFGVANYREFVATQADAAIRAIASHYPYDAHDEQVESLKGSPDAISGALVKLLQDRLQTAGIEVIECRLSDLAYAPEIAQSMLRRQQAEAQIAARRYIVDNVVTIVEQVLVRLQTEAKITLDGSQKVQLINNLLIALVSERDAAPVINVGQ